MERSLEFLARQAESNRSVSPGSWPPARVEVLVLAHVARLLAGLMMARAVDLTSSRSAWLSPAWKRRLRVVGRAGLQHGHLPVQPRQFLICACSCLSAAISLLQHRCGLRRPGHLISASLS